MGTMSFLSGLGGQTHEDQYDALYEMISGIVADASGLDMHEVEPTTPFMSMGLNSVIAVEISEKLQEELGISLQPTMVWAYPYMQSLTDHLLEKLKKEDKF